MDLSPSPAAQPPQAIQRGLAASKTGTLDRLLILVLFCLGIGLRSYRLDEPPIWVDEAESSINALTILDYGVPVDHYLGMPIFENTLLRPWPESEEYEFKDISYSAKGLAIYHAWLPLYAIAASLAAFGVEPDNAVEPPQVLHASDTIGWRSLIPRIPSILFSALFLVTVYSAGRALYGTDAGLGALALCALLSRMIWFGRQARYYSATLAFTSLAGMAVWKAATRGGWRDFVLLGASLVLLFHSHILSFIILASLWAITLPFSLWIPRLGAKIASAVLIMVGGIAPWMWFTGFLEGAEVIPKAWQVFPLSQLMPVYLVPKLTWILAALAGLLFLSGLVYLSEKLPLRIERPLRGLLKPLVFLSVWAAVAFAEFSLLIPAVSFSLLRMNLVLATPVLLFAGVGCAALGRFLAPSRSSLVTTVLLVGALWGAGRISTEFLREPLITRERWQEVSGWLQQHPFPTGTRFYSIPNQHLVLTYLTGLPVQSIAPVRESYLESHPGDIVLIEALSRYTRLRPREIMAVASANGIPLSETDSLQWEGRLMIEGVIADLDGKVRRFDHPEYEPSPLSAPLRKRQLEVTSARIQEDLIEFLVVHDLPISRWTDFWPAYFYRFADVQRRMAEGPVYEQLLSQAEAFIMPSSWLIYHWDRDGVPSVSSP